MDKMIQCWECRGDGKLLLWSSASSEEKNFLVCMRCNGEGKVKEEMIEWHENGKILANKRRDYGLKMRDAAKYLKIEVTNLSKMERGIIEPNMSINYNKMRVIKQ